VAQAVDAWFAARGWKVFPFQRAVWRAALAGQSGLLHANTGAGKTYAVWFAALLRGKRGRRSARAAACGCCGSRRCARWRPTPSARWRVGGDLAPAWTIGARTGDTSSAERARQARKLPTALITTPESLSLLLSHARRRSSSRTST
jgi:ATP-dependent Lhr-like helicase